MAQFSISDEVLPATWLEQYKVPLHTVGSGADLYLSKYETVDGKKSGDRVTKAELISIEESTCPVRHKDFYIWTWRTSKYDSYDGKDAEGNHYSWITLTDTLFREGASLKAFLDNMTEANYSLSDWQTVGLGTLIAKTYSVMVRRDRYDIVADGPDSILGDTPRLHEYACRVVSAAMLDGAATRFAQQVAAATTPLPAPVERETVAEMHINDIEDAEISVCSSRSVREQAV